MSKKTRCTYYFSIVLILSYFIYSISNILYDNNIVYAIEQINKYDSLIFNNNLGVITSGISPRYFMNFIFQLGLHITNGTWSNVAIPLIYLGVAILALAVVKIIFNLFDKHQILLSVLFAFFIKNSINNGFPGWGTFELNSLGMGTAYAFVMLALSEVMGINKKWNKALLLLSIATLFHIHEGIWGFCLLFIIYLCECVKQKRIIFGKNTLCFFFFLIILGIGIIPQSVDKDQYSFHMKKNVV